MTNLINIIPNPDPLPVAAGWFQFLLHLTYYLHLISVGIMFSIAISMAVGYFKGKSDENWLAFGKEMGHLLPFTIAFAVNMGVAPLLFIQVLYGNFFYTASTLIGTNWILLIVILILGYYGAYWISFRESGKPGTKRFLSLFVSIVLAWTGFILVNVNTLMMRPMEWKSYFSHMGGFHLNTGDPTMLPRYTFYVFFLLAIGGLFIAVYSKIKFGENNSKPWIAYGSSLSGYSSFLTLPSFILYMRILPHNIREVFIFGDVVWTIVSIICFSGIIVTGYLALKRKIIPASVVMGINLVVFVIMRGKLRSLFLEPFSEKLSSIGTNTQYGVMILFLVTLVAGLGLVFWMLRKTYKELKGK